MKEFSYCVPGLRCPLTDLQITQSPTNPDPQRFDNSDFVKSKADTYLWFSRAGLGGPITDLKISQQFPCLNSKFISWNLARPIFPLNAENVRQCDQDKRYQDLQDQISEKLLFSINQAQHQTIELIDGSNPQWSKYYRPGFPVKNSCQSQTKRILSSDIKFSTVGRVLMILAIILSSLKVILAIGEVLLYLEITKSQDSHISRILRVTGNINLTFVITLLIFCFYSKKGLQTYANFLNEFLYNQCSD